MTRGFYLKLLLVGTYNANKNFQLQIPKYSPFKFKGPSSKPYLSQAKHYAGARLGATGRGDLAT
jgi:hypothetical protein